MIASVKFDSLTSLASVKIILFPPLNSLTKMYISPMLIFLRQRAAFFLQITAIAFNVFDHEIFSR